MTHSYVCHDAFICVTWHVVCVTWFVYTNASWRVTYRLRDVCKTCVWHVMCVMYASYLWVAVCCSVLQRVEACCSVLQCVEASYMWHVVCVTWFVYVRDMMHSCVCEVFYSIKTCRAERQSRKRVAVRSTHKCEMTYVCVMTQVCNIALSCVCGMMWRKRMSTMGWPRWVGSLTL